MRYVAKIHVLDILDTVVVSGYVHEHDSINGWAPDVWEFSYVTPSYGENDPADWLMRALHSAIAQITEEDSRTTWSPLPDGVPHTVSETGGMRQMGVD